MNENMNHMRQMQEHLDHMEALAGFVVEDAHGVEGGEELLYMARHLAEQLREGIAPLSARIQRMVFADLAAPRPDLGSDDWTKKLDGPPLRLLGGDDDHRTT